MSRTLLIALALILVAAIGLTWLWMRSEAAPMPPAADHDHDHDHDHGFARPDNPKVSHIDAFREHNKERLDELMQDPAFAGGEIDEPVAAPSSTVRMMDGFKVKVPDLDEARIESDTYAEQLTYTLGNLNPDLLDGMMDEYRHEYGTLIQEMGLAADCDGAQCGYRIHPGPFLTALGDNGLQSNDVILTLNSIHLSSIGSYDRFKEFLFSRSDTLELGIARDGNVSVVTIPIRQAATASTSPNTP